MSGIKKEKKIHRASTITDTQPIHNCSSTFWEALSMYMFGSTIGKEVVIGGGPIWLLKRAKKQMVSMKGMTPRHVVQRIKRPYEVTHSWGVLPCNLRCVPDRVRDMSFKFGRSHPSVTCHSNSEVSS